MTVGLIDLILDFVLVVCVYTELFVLPPSLPPFLLLLRASRSFLPISLSYSTLSCYKCLSLLCRLAISRVSP